LTLPATTRTQLKVFPDSIHFEEGVERVAAYRSVANRFAYFAFDYFVTLLYAHLEGAVDVGLSASKTLEIIPKLHAFY
jgi:hypothetical protein